MTDTVVTTVVTLPATNIAQYYFDMNGSFETDPPGHPAFFNFFYKIGIDGDIVQAWPADLGPSYSPVTFPLSSGVCPNTLYYYMAYARLVLPGGVYGGWISVTTLPFIVSTQFPTNIGATTATFHGDCTPNGYPFLYGFKWKKGIAGVISSWEAGPMSSAPFSHDVSGLLPDEIYYVRATSQPNSSPLLYGEWIKFVTSALSIAITYDATNVGNVIATLNGETVPGADGPVLESGFEWNIGGAITYYTTRVKVLDSDGIYDLNLTDLEVNTLYCFRAYGKVAGRTFFGEVFEFTTTKIVPTVTTEIATDLEALTVTGNGTIVSCGDLETSCKSRGFDIVHAFFGTLKEYNAWKEYGFIGDIVLDEETGLWSGPIAKEVLDGGVGPFPADVFVLAITDLISGMVYEYCAKAENEAGWGYGEYLEFETDPLLVRKACTCGIFTIMLCAYVNPIPAGSIIKRRGFRWGIYNTAQEHDVNEDGNFSASAVIDAVDTISFVCSNDNNIYDTIVDSGKGFNDAGFVAGLIIDVTATGVIDPKNETQFRIISVSVDGGTIEVNVRNTLVSEAVNGVTIVELFALYIVDLDPETDYYSVAYIAIEDSEGIWTVQEGSVTLTTTIANIFDFEGYDKVENYKPEREQNYKKITRKIEAEIIAEQVYIEMAGGRRILDIKNHLIQSKENAMLIGIDYKDTFKSIKSIIEIEYPTPPPFQREDTLDFGFGRIRFKEDGMGVVNFMPDGEGLMVFRYRMIMMIRKINMAESFAEDSVSYVATMELEEA